MAKYKYKRAALIISGLFLFSCQPKKPETTAFSGKKIAHPIVYEVVIKNPNEEDEWASECLAHTDTQSMIEDILEAVKKGELPAFDYYTNNRLNCDEIEKVLNIDTLRKRIGKVQFEENWYWDKNQLQLRKEVKKLMFGYEIYDSNGKLRGYKASFVVNLGGKGE